MEGIGLFTLLFDLTTQGIGLARRRYLPFDWLVDDRQLVSNAAVRIEPAVSSSIEK